MHRPLTRATWPVVPIDVRLVRIEVAWQRLSPPLTELLVAADRLRVRLVDVAHPHRQWRAPISIARKCPVDVVFQPFAESAGTGFLGLPEDTRIAREHLIAKCRRAHEPRLTGVVQKRRAASPAVRVRVLDGRGLPQETAPL